MNKKFIKSVIAVVLGLALAITLIATFSLIFDAIMSSDVATLSSVSKSMEKVLSYTRNTAIGVVFVNIAMLACFCFTYFIKTKKVFGCISTVLSLLSAAMCIAFVFDLRAIVLKSTSLQSYSAATGYFSELISLAAAALLFFAYFLFVTVKSFRSEKVSDQVIAEFKTEDETKAVTECIAEKENEKN
jgi:hypothetical protein